MAVRDIDRGYKRILKNLTQLDRLGIIVGVLKEAGATDGITYAELATIHEYGTAHIPARPFLRIATENNTEKWQDMTESCADLVMSGKATPEQVAKLVGNQAVGDVQEVIGDRGLLAPNAPATVKRKGSDAPLIDSGKLRQKVDFRLEKG